MNKGALVIRPRDYRTFDDFGIVTNIEDDKRSGEVYWLSGPLRGETLAYFLSTIEEYFEVYGEHKENFKCMEPKIHGRSRQAEE